MNVYMKAPYSEIFTDRESAASTIQDLFCESRAALAAFDVRCDLLEEDGYTPEEIEALKADEATVYEWMTYRAYDLIMDAETCGHAALYGVEMSVEALKAELRSAYRSSILNPGREYLVMLDRNSGRLWTHERHLGDTRIPLLHRCVPLYAFRDFGEDILTEWYWGNLYDSERNEAVEEYTDCETWEGIKADAEQFGCEPWELALEDRDIRLHFRNEAADAFLDDYDGRESLECIYDIVLDEAASWAKEAAR